MSRPFFNYSGEQLARLFGEKSEEVAVLHALLEELQHRTTPKMRTLREQVERKLAALDGDALRKSNGEAAAAIGAASSRHAEAGRDDSNFRHSSPDTEDADAATATTDYVPGSTGLKSGELGSIRPCGGLKDVPSKRYFPEKTDLTLDVPSNASLQVIYRSALSALIQEMKRKGTGTKRVTVEDGRFVPLDGRENGYKFRIEGDEELFEGAGVTAFVGSHRVEGRIVSVLVGEIIITLAEHFGPTIHSAVLQVDNTAMLQALADRLEKVIKGEVTLNLELARDAISNAGSEMPPEIPADFIAKHNLNSAQTGAVAMALANPMSYLWGPPGTGKTTSLAVLLELLFDSGKRILICSNTNQAVDQVLLKVCDRLTVSHPALEEGRIVRVGRASHPELVDKYRQYVTLDGIVERKSTALRSQKENLEQQIGSIRTSTETPRRVLEAYGRLDTREAEVRQLEKNNAKAASDLNDAETKAHQLAQQAVELEEELKQWTQAGFVRRLVIRSEQVIKANMARVSQERQNAARATSAATQAVASATETLHRAQAVRDELRDVLKGQDREATERVLREAETKIAPLQSRLVEVNKQLDDIAKAVMDEARIVGATVTKGYLSPQLFSRFDVVIVDEASMVMLPALFHAVGLATSKAVISGDFRQLPPIVTSDQKAIRDVIGRDVFHSAGIVDAFQEKRSLKRTVMLDEQYRMAEPICGLVNQPMYDGRLSTLVSPSSAEIPLPFPYDAPLVLIDTSALTPFVNRDLFGSRFNLMNALVTRNLCRHLVDAGSVADIGDVGVCAPYAAQAKLMRRILASYGLQNRIEAGTIHRYQGDEKNTIIIDIPDSLGEPSVGIFLQADHPDEDGAKLFNVAVSRAKKHLILVGNLAYLDQRLPNNAFVREILYKVFSRGRVVDARDVLALWPIDEDLKRFGREFDLAPEALERGLFRDRDFQAVCMADIEAAKQSVAIFSGFVTPQRVAAYADLFRSKLQEGVKIRCVTRPPKHNGSIPVDQGRETLDALEHLGCVVDTRWDIHQKVVIIDDAVVWFGSLNPLSHTGQTDEMMVRLEGREAALQIAAFMSLNRRVDADSAAGLSVTKENPQCPDCGSRTTYRKGRYGPYWQCEAQCGWTESLDKPRGRASNANPLPRDGAPPCPKCGAATVPRTGRYGPFYGCTRYPKCDGIAKPPEERRRTARRSSRATGR